MKIRFLQTTESPVVGFPFMPGQIIDVHPTEEWLALLDGVRAEAVKDDESEYAIARAVTPAPAPAPRPRGSSGPRLKGRRKGER